MRMGLYYSGGYDWPYNDAVLTRASDAVLAAPQDRRYLEYVTAQVRELIDRYEPSVLWNDISWPSGGNLAELFAHYYNTVEDGVVNDRWVEPGLRRSWLTDAGLRVAGALLQLGWPVIPERRKRLTFGAPRHCDFRTPEYEALHTASAKKWELARGVGHSFGANRHERPEDIISDTELIRLFCDVVSKNGNLLIGVGPRPDGTIPESQQAPLRGLGSWLEANGEAIYGSRSWMMPESEAADGTPLRFTLSGDGVYCLVLGMPAGRRIVLRAIDAGRVSRVRVVATGELAEWSEEDGALVVTLPDRLPMSAVTALDLGEGVRARLATAGPT
jgi:alpha-L-fucosidase